MTRNPFLNALAASLYIVVVASALFYVPKFVGPVDSVLAPIAMLSLFVLSAAVMGYVFCYEPLQLFLEGSKKEAADLFVKTVGIFAVITLFIFCILFLISIRAV